MLGKFQNKSFMWGYFIYMVILGSLLSQCTLKQASDFLQFINHSIQPPEYSDTNTHQSNSTLLDWAKSKNDTNAITMLSDPINNINSPLDEQKHALLHKYTESNDLEAVKFLIQQGAKINVLSKDKSTPLTIAMEEGHVDIFNELMAHPSIKLSSFKNSKPLLITAIEKGNISIFARLLNDKRINVNQTYKNSTALHTIASLENISGEVSGEHRYEIMEELLKHPNININITNRSGNTPLHQAVESHANGQLLRLIRNPYILLNKKNNLGNTAFALAVTKSNVDGFKLLLYNAIIHTKNNEGNTPLHLAFLKENNPETMNINTNEIISKLFPFYQKHLNIQNNKGNTILHIAAKNNSSHLENLLKNTKMDQNIKNNDEKIAKDIAAVEAAKKFQ